MGGCLSTNTPSKHPKNSNNTSQDTNVSKSPPPSHPFLEEETVKEVLSETPSDRSRVNRHSEGPFIKTAPLLLHEFKKPGGGDDISDDLVSESESVSVYMAVRERNDPQRRHQSPAKRTNTSFPGEARREKTVGRSPNRARPIPGSRNLRRDGGESSGRRSRSPVTRTDSGDSGRSTFSRKTGISPGRVRAGTPKVDGEREEIGDNIWPPTSGESLENPVVSMECFIFL